MPVGKTRNNENPKNDTLQQMAIILNTLDLRTEYEIFPMDEEVSEGPFLHDNFPSIHKSHVHGMLTDLGLLVPRLGDLVPQTQFSEMKQEERDVERKKARVDMREENLILVKNELQMVD